MATTTGPAHGAPAVPGLALSGMTSSAALPAIGLNGGGASPLGRERSNTMSLGAGPPRKEASYASSTASKISIASLPLDTLEHIIDDFKTNPTGSKPAHGRVGHGRNTMAQHSVRINLSPSPPPAGPGRNIGRTWHGAGLVGGGGAGGGGGRWHAGGPGSMSFTFSARAVTPHGGPAPPPPAPPPVIPGLPPGAAPLALSSRAAAVLQGSDSAAHLQRFLALDSGQLENHFIIASPSGVPITDLQEICFDGAASVDGLPPGREAVVVLTNTPDGVPVPRVIPLDQPGPSSIRRTGMTAVLAATGSSTPGSGSGPYGPDSPMPDPAPKSSGSSGLLGGPPQTSSVDADGGYGGDVEHDGPSTRPPYLAVPFSPQRSSAPARDLGGVFGPHSAAARSAAVAAIGGHRSPARRSETGGSRPSTYGRQHSTPSAPVPASPPVRLTPSSPMAVHSQQTHHHLTSTYSMLPSLPDGTAAVGPAGGGVQSPVRRGSSGAYVGSSARQWPGSGEALPVLVRMNSPDHAPPGGVILTGDGGGGDGDLAGGRIAAGPGQAMAAGGVGNVLSSPRYGSAGRGRAGVLDDGLVSPTRTRLQARINNLQNERERNSSIGVNNAGSPHGAAGHHAGLAPGGAGSGSGKGPAYSHQRSTVLSNLSGMDLVKAALKQVETGEQTLVRVSASGSANSRRASRTSFTGAPAPPAAAAVELPLASDLPPAADAEPPAADAVAPEDAEAVAAVAAIASAGGDEATAASAAPAAVGIREVVPEKGLAQSLAEARRGSQQEPREPAPVDPEREARERAQREAAEREEREAAERRQARLVRSLTKLLTTGRTRRPSSAHSHLGGESIRRLPPSRPESRAESVANDDEDDEEEEEEEVEQAKDTEAKPSSARRRPHPPKHARVRTGSRPTSASAATATVAGEKPADAAAGGQSQPGSEPGEVAAPRAATAAAAAAADAADAEGDDTLDAAAAVAADGGLDADALVEFAQQLDRANMEFRLVEAARERTRRVEAILHYAAMAAQQQQQQHLQPPVRRRSSVAGESTASSSGAAPSANGTVSGAAAGSGGEGGGQRSGSSPERAGSGQGLDLHLLARRREVKPQNVMQVIASLEAPLDRPMEVDLEQLLADIGGALLADEADVQAIRFDETFRIRTERYLTQLCRLNPAAFEEVSAAQAEADYRSSVERAKLRLRQLHGEVAGEPLTSAGKPRNQYDKAVVMLQAHRPFFLPPVIPRETVERAPVPPMLGGRGSTRPPWDVYASIFRERKRSDARDLYDNEAVLAAQFNLDWSRTVSKMLFMKLVAREDLGVRQVRGKNGRAALEQELGQVREALAEAFGMIRAAFTYYSIADPEEVYTAAVSAAVAAASASGGRAEAAAAEVAAAAAAAAVRRGAAAASSGTAANRAASPDAVRPTEVPTVEESAAAAAAAAASAASGTNGGTNGGYGFLEMDEQRWLAFCTSAGVTGRTPGVRVSDLKLLFWTVNREEERNMTLESVENNDNAFVRFEFMEALVRAAFGRYITPGTLRDASDATRRLIEHLKMSLPPIAMVDPNEFRRNRLYTAEMEVAVVHNLELLTASFKLFKARDRAKYLGIDHWMSFLETNNLLAPHMGALTVTEAKLIFAWSQMLVVDELKLRRRAVSLQLWDFVEAVARLAERVALPNTDEMDKWMLYNLNIGKNTPLPPGHTRVWTYCSALATGRGGPGLERRASGHELLPGPAPAGAPPTRTLATKFRLLMEYLAGSLADSWGGNNTHETAQSMLRTANMLCGGVELA